MDASALLHRKRNCKCRAVKLEAGSVGDWMIISAFLARCQVLHAVLDQLIELPAACVR